MVSNGCIRNQLISANTFVVSVLVRQICYYTVGVVNCTLFAFRVGSVGFEIDLTCSAANGSF